MAYSAANNESDYGEVITECNGYCWKMPPVRSIKNGIVTSHALVCNTLCSFVRRWYLPSFLQNNFYSAASFTATYPVLPGGNSVFWDDDIAYNKVQSTLALLSNQSSGAASAKMVLSPSGSAKMGIAWVGHSFTPKWVGDAQPSGSSTSPCSVKQNITHWRPCQGHQKEHWSGHVPSEWENRHELAWATDRGSLHNGKDAGGQL